MRTPIDKYHFTRFDRPFGSSTRFSAHAIEVTIPRPVSYPGCALFEPRCLPRYPRTDTGYRIHPALAREQPKTDGLVPEDSGRARGALLGVRDYEECLVAIVIVGLNRHHLSRDGVEKDQCVPEMVEVEHIGQRTCQSVERIVDLAEVPIVFDEPKDRALIREGVIHEILLCPTGNDLQRDSWTPAAAGLETAKRIRAGAAHARSGQGIRRGGGLVNDLAELVVVPYVGIVPFDDHGSF